MGDKLEKILSNLMSAIPRSKEETYVLFLRLLYSRGASVFY